MTVSGINRFGTMIAYLKAAIDFAGSYKDASEFFSKRNASEFPQSRQRILGNRKDWVCIWTGESFLVENCIGVFPGRTPPRRQV
jgi:hypothetical protein